MYGSSPYVLFLLKGPLLTPGIGLWQLKRIILWRHVSLLLLFSALLQSFLLHGKGNVFPNGLPLNWGLLVLDVEIIQSLQIGFLG